MQKNILLGITSSISAYKIYELIRIYKKNNFNVKVVLSPNAKNFVSPLVLETLSEEKCYIEEFVPRDNTQHINLCMWADIFVVAPISANSISKCATGIADNLLTSIFCAFLGTKKPILIAPAMNENMLNNPIIQENIQKLKNYNCDIVESVVGYLACGTVGNGRLAGIDKIFKKTMRLLYQNKENNNKTVVVTIGGTKEKIDNVRYITNSSSGKMGTALADWAYYFGYNVVAITTVELIRPYKTISVSSALEMLDELIKLDFDYLIMASAVADFRVDNPSDKKISKEETDDIFNLKLTQNPDILTTISKSKKENQKLIGFCLTDNDLMNSAKKKLENKNLDYIIANEIKSALNTDTNNVTIISKSGKIIDVDKASKNEIAKKILEVVCD